MSDIRDFHLAIPQAEIESLHAKLDAACWPEKEPVEDWAQGTPLSVLRELVDCWRHKYDWRRCEAQLNGLGQYVTEIGGLDVHFLHVRSTRAVRSL